MLVVPSPGLYAAWWVDNMDEGEEEEGMTLPDELWSAMEQLQTTSESSLVQRLAIEHQVAHTAYSSVFTAVLDGGSKVIVKASRLAGAALAVCRLHHEGKRERAGYVGCWWFAKDAVFNAGHKYYLPSSCPAEDGRGLIQR